MPSKWYTFSRGGWRGEALSRAIRPSDPAVPQFAPLATDSQTHMLCYMADCDLTKETYCKMSHTCNSHTLFNYDAAHLQLFQNKYQHSAKCVNIHPHGCQQCCDFPRVHTASVAENFFFHTHIYTKTPLHVIMIGSLGQQPSYISRFCSHSFLNSHMPDRVASICILRAHAHWTRVICCHLWTIKYILFKSLLAHAKQKSHTDTMWRHRRRAVWTDL